MPKSKNDEDNKKQEPILDIEIEENESIEEGENALDDENEQEAEGQEEEQEEEDEDVKEEDKEQREKTDQEIPEEAQALIRPSMKKKTQKRIVSLVNKVKQQDQIIAQLLKKENERSQKEVDTVKQTKYQEILKKQQKAFEDGDMAKVSEANLEILNLSQNNQKSNIMMDENFNPETYFQEKHKWYNVDERKTNMAIGIDSKLRQDPIWKDQPHNLRLDEVGKRTEKLFKKNPYRKSSPSEGAPIARGSNSSVSITSQDMEVYKKMYPGLNNAQLAAQIKKIQTNIKATTRS